MAAVSQPNQSNSGRKSDAVLEGNEQQVGLPLQIGNEEMDLLRKRMLQQLEVGFPITTQSQKHHPWHMDHVPRQQNWRAIHKTVCPDDALTVWGHRFK